ncbi:hypothetical protein [Rubripirellula tenax]|uniref:hypothetical protein n=1 Tax=Rubripirellula tenax TaxID=2528015 RepID=UPI0011B7D144|nr:hypothetical protein [Rubripirellula tenax]
MSANGSDVRAAAIDFPFVSGDHRRSVTITWLPAFLLVVRFDLAPDLCCALTIAIEVKAHDTSAGTTSHRTTGPRNNKSFFLANIARKYESNVRRAASSFVALWHWIPVVNVFFRRPAGQQASKPMP